MQKEKRLVPQLRFPEFEDKLEITTFGKVIQSTLYGPRFNANDYNENGNVKTIRGTDLNNDGEISYDQVPLALLDHKMVAIHKLEDGDIVMITTADCGAVGVFRRQEIDYLSSAYGVRIRLNELGNPFYFKYFFQTWLAKREINKYIRKATVANLPGSDILRIKLNLISISEQQKIATFLTAIDNRLQSLEKKKSLLEEYKKGLMQQVFKQVLRFKPALSGAEVDEDGKDYPEWEKKKLGDVSSKKSSNIAANKIEENFGDYIIYGASGVLKKVDFYEEKNDYISIVKDGAGVGRIFYCKGKTSVLGTMEIIKPKNGLNTYFLYCLLEGINFKKYITGSTIPHIYYKDYKKENIGVPCLEEQTKIANFLSAIDKKIALVDKQIEKTKTYKKGLLQQMFV